MESTNGKQSKAQQMDHPHVNGEAAVDVTEDSSAHTDHKQHHHHHAAKWHDDGFFQKPKILVEWAEDGTGKFLLDGERKVTWSELFYDLIYVTCIAKMGGDLRESNMDALTYIIGFFALWNTWYSCIIYSTWMLTDDLFHKISQFFLMMSIVSAGMHFGGGADAVNARGFCVSFAVARLILVLGYIWAMACLPRFRTMGVPLVFCHSVIVAMWMAAGFVGSSTAAMGIGIASVVWDWVFPIMLVGRLVPKSKRLPLHLEHIIERFGLFIVIVLGETVTGITVTTNGHESLAIYVSVGLGLAIVLSLKMLYFDTDIRDIQDHALRRGRTTAFLWLFSHPIMAVAMAMMGSGIEFIIHQTVHHAEGEEAHWQEVSGRKWLGYGVAIVFVIMGTHSRIHNPSYACRTRNPEGVQCKKERDHEGPCEYVENPTPGSHLYKMRMIDSIQFITHMVFGAALIALTAATSPSNLSSLGLLGVTAAMAALLVGVNLMDEVIVHKYHKTKTTGPK